MKEIFDAFRDLFLGMLPSSVCPKPCTNYFAFLCHPLDARDAIRKYSFAKNIDENLFNLWTTHFWPVLGAEILWMPSMTEMQVRGWAVIQPVPPAFMIRDPQFGRKKIINAVKFCEKLGFNQVALGGYNSIITHDGQDLIGRVNIAVTTGNTYSALLVIENLEKIAKFLEINLRKSKIAIIGAAGSVGSACAKIIPTMAGEVWLMDNNTKALNEIGDEISKKFSNIKLFKELNLIRNLDVVITATSTPWAIITDQHIRAGMIFIDAAQPKNISEDIARHRKDVVVIDSGIAYVPKMKCKMSMGPNENEVYACLGEAMILAHHKKVSNYSIGKVSPEKVYELKKMATKSGFRVAAFRNASGYISENDLQYFKKEHVLA
jgi:predicted amino acid dehydrogenase